MLPDRETALVFDQSDGHAADAQAAVDAFTTALSTASAWALSFTGHAEMRMEQRGVTEARLLVVVTAYEVSE